MAQRVRSCTNNTGFDTINCESYLQRLLKPNKSPIVNKSTCAGRCPRDRSSSRAKTAATALVAPNVANPRARPGAFRQVTPAARTRSTPTEFTHKEIITDNAGLVEVTVRAHTGRPARTGDGVQNNQPWAKLLKTTKSNGALSSFGSFDPLRTLHFLAKELQSQLKSTVPDNPKVMEMITNMQQALDRVPSEVAETIRLQQDLEKLKVSSSDDLHYRNKLLIDQTEVPEKLSAIKPRMKDKLCQTSSSTSTATANFQKQLEENRAKLEASCKQMEMVCNQLRNEKEEAEHLLHDEKDTVTFLRKQIEDLQTEKIEHSNALLERLNQERNTLQRQVKALQSQLDLRHGPTVQELKLLVDEVKMEKSVIDQENLSLRHKLTLSNMEKEKYVAILNVRNRQLNEIKFEMNQLQEIVNEQLLELQRAPLMPMPSSQSTFAEFGKASRTDASITGMQQRDYYASKILRTAHDALPKASSCVRARQTYYCWACRMSNQWRLVQHAWCIHSHINNYSPLLFLHLLNNSGSIPKCLTMSPNR